MNFDSFVGNSRIVSQLRTKLRQGRFPHGVLLSGPEGVGKHTLAIMLAKALNCSGEIPGRRDFGAVSNLLQEPRTGDTICDRCSNCHKINAGTHADVMTIAVNEEASQIRIAQIRQVLSLLSFQPLEGRNKVFVIDPANLMNLESANALLKGLEEPPPNSFFVLVSVNVHELPVTVRSRCQVYHFSPLTLGDIRKHGIEDELLVRWSQGSIGRARTTDSEVLKQQREFLLGFLETALGASETEFQQMLSASAALSRSKQDFGNHLAILVVLVSDLLYITENIPEQIVNIDIQDRIRRLAASVSVERILRIAEFLQFIEKSMKNYVNRQMLTDVLAIVANEMTSKILHDNSFKSR